MVWNVSHQAMHKVSLYFYDKSNQKFEIIIYSALYLNLKHDKN